MAFTHPVSVRFSDMDAMGHVNNARYLTYFEEARFAFLAHIAGDGPSLSDGGMVLARIECDYRRPIVAKPAPLQVSVAVCAVGDSSFTLVSDILADGGVAASSRAVLVGYDYTQQRSRPLTSVDGRASKPYRTSLGTSDSPTFPTGRPLWRRGVGADLGGDEGDSGRGQRQHRRSRCGRRPSRVVVPGVPCQQCFTGLGQSVVPNLPCLPRTDVGALIAAGPGPSRWARQVRVHVRRRPAGDAPRYPCLLGNRTCSAY